MKCVVIVLSLAASWHLFDSQSRSEGESVPKPRADHIREVRQQIDALRTAKDLAGLQQLARVAENEWLRTKDVDYYPAILELCTALRSTAPTSTAAYNAMRHLAVTAIDFPGEKPWDVAGKLVMLLQGDPEYSRGQLKGEEWVVERHARAERCLMVLRSIRNQLAAMPKPGPFNLYADPPMGFPVGVAPSAIKDPKLRKQYEDAIEVNTRNANEHEKKRDLTDFEKFFTTAAKRQLVEAYCKPPFRTADLEKVLEGSGVDTDFRVAVLAEVTKRVAERAKQDAKMPSSPPSMVITEPAPPGTSAHHGDPRLRKKVTFNMPSPKVEDVLQRLSQETGVNLVRADDIQNKYASTGSISVTGVPAWRVMDDLAASKRVEGVWQQDGDGYRLASNGNAVDIPEAVDEKQPPTHSNLRRNLVIATAAVLALVTLLILVRRRVRATKPATSKDVPNV